MCANGLNAGCSDGPALRRSCTALAVALSLSLSSVAHADRADYTALIEFSAPDNFFAAYTDDFFSVTHFFFGDYPGNRIVRHTVDPGLNRTESALPIPYGLVWIADDLDGDGHIELVVQRGDPGMGGNGYLDIHSAPDWVLRARITLPDMKLVFFPVAIDVDGDGDLEIFLAPGTMSGSARAMIIDYDRPSGTFVVRADIAAPAGTYGHTAAGDFDGDGRVEFITGNDTGYGLFEFDASTPPGGLFYRGQVGDPYPGTHATALRPMPGGGLHALLGHSSFVHGYRYQLLRPTGDNTFGVAHVFHEYHGYAGHQPSYGLDADGDGLDEIVMEFHPYARVYEWNPAAAQFEVAWTWDQTGGFGTFITWADADLDRDGTREWCCADHLNVVRAFEDQDAASGLPGRDQEGQPALTGRAGLMVFPNPTDGHVRIEWTRVPDAAAPRIMRVHDADGRVVRTWFAPDAGWHAAGIDWDGRDAAGAMVPGGVYFCRLTAGGRTTTGRVVVVR